MGIALSSSRRSVVLSILTLAVLLPPATVSQAQPATPTPRLAPQPAQLQNPIAATQIAFLSGYVGRTTKELTKDKQIRALMKLTIPRTEFHYGRDMSLSDVLEEALSGSSAAVERSFRGN
jgi:hypothetical protein